MVTSFTSAQSFQPGDHVYFSQGGIKHHAIVVKAKGAGGVEVLEFGAFGGPGDVILSLTGLAEAEGEVRRKAINTVDGDWELVEYEKGDPQLRLPSQVVAAALFLEENSDLLPPYHLTSCNCECFARWCKRGEFTSGQSKGFYKAVEAITSPLSSTKMSFMGEAIRGRRQQVGNKWDETKTMLDDAFEEYMYSMQQRHGGFQTSSLVSASG